MEPSDVNGARLWLAGLFTALIAAAAAAITFLIAEGLLDLDLLRRGAGSSDEAPLEFAHVVVVALWITVCATGLLHVLLLTTERAVTVFIWTGVAILALSFIPIIALDADAGVKIMQSILHVVVAIPIITILTRTANNLVTPPSDAEAPIVLTPQETQTRIAPDGQTRLIGQGFWVGDTRGQSIAADDRRLTEQGGRIVDIVGMEQFPEAAVSESFEPGRHLLLVPDTTTAGVIGVWDALPSRQIGWLPTDAAAAVAASLAAGDARRATSLWEWRTSGDQRLSLTIVVAPDYLSEAEAAGSATPTWAWLTLTGLTVALGIVGVLVINALGDPPDSEAEELITDLNEGVTTANEGLTTTNDLLGQMLAGIESRGGAGN